MYKYDNFCQNRKSYDINSHRIFLKLGTEVEHIYRIHQKRFQGIPIKIACTACFCTNECGCTNERSNTVGVNFFCFVFEFGLSCCQGVHAQLFGEGDTLTRDDEEDVVFDMDTVLIVMATPEYVLWIRRIFVSTIF